jgi:hypothetical protein
VLGETRRGLQEIQQEWFPKQRSSSEWPAAMSLPPYRVRRMLAHGWSGSFLPPCLGNHLVASASVSGVGDQGTAIFAPTVLPATTSRADRSLKSSLSAARPDGCACTDIRDPTHRCMLSVLDLDPVLRSAALDRGAWRPVHRGRIRRPPGQRLPQLKSAAFDAKRSNRRLSRITTRRCTFGLSRKSMILAL